MIPGDASKVAEKLYSGSGGRFIVSVASGRAGEFEAIVPGAARIGTVGGSSLRVTGVLNEQVDALRESWQKTFKFHLIHVGTPVRILDQ